MQIVEKLIHELASYSGAIKLVIGAITGVLLTVLFARLTAALKLNGGRKYIIYYMQDTAKDKLECFISDAYYARQEINGVILPEEVIKQGYDNMPMLTSEVFKSIPAQEMARIMYNRINLKIIMEWYYAVDYLKDHMPFTIRKEYFKEANSHNAVKDLKSLADIVYHAEIEQCGTIKNYRDIQTKQLQLCTIAAYECLLELNELTHRLSGPGWWWVLKYVLKF